MINWNTTPLLPIQNFVTHSSSDAPDVGERLNHKVNCDASKAEADKPSMHLFKVRWSPSLVEYLNPKIY